MYAFVMARSVAGGDATEQTRLTATATSFQPDQGNEPDKAVDGDEKTFWHSAWNPHALLPQSITVDQGTPGTVACLAYLPRQSGGSNGTITTYNIYVSTDGKDFTKVVSAGKWPANAARKFANFPATPARYVRLEAVEGVGGFASAAEISLSATPILYSPNQVTVLSPAYCSDIQGDTTLSIAAPGMTSAVVKCWKQGDGFGSDSTVGTVTFDSQGKGSILFKANEYPHGPLSVRISASHGKVNDNCYLQLYNKGGVSWNEEMPKDAPPPAAGMTLVFADDFSGPLSISGDAKAKYYDHKPGGGDFSSLPFTSFAAANNPFARVDNYLRIRASEKANSSGLISSLKENGTGTTTSLPCYFECRFIAQTATGTWPGFWIMTDYMTERLKHAEKHGPDELDIIEAYGGEGPGRPNAYDKYRITSHFWEQGSTGKSQKGVDNAISMHELGGKSTWSDTFHTYGCKITATDTIYYCDNIEVGRHPTGAVSKQYPFFFLINLATGGGWPVDLSRYDGTADMYVKYVTVWHSGGNADAKALETTSTAGTASTVETTPKVESPSKTEKLTMKKGSPNPATALDPASDNSVDGVTLCWFNGKLKWGKVGILREGEETPWFNGATPRESTNADGQPYKFRKENIPGGSINQWDAYAAHGDFPIKAGDKLFVYVFLDPQDPPFEILLQLRANNSYDHRAFWGTVNKITHMEPPLTGPLPAAGKWIRLEVDPSVLNVGVKSK
jgi:beta-glucanase (GH16 family)